MCINMHLNYLAYQVLIYLFDLGAAVVYRNRQLISAKTAHALQQVQLEPQHRVAVDHRERRPDKTRENVERSVDYILFTAVCCSRITISLVLPFSQPLVPCGDVLNVYVSS
jgi:hypothetical protein